MKKHEIGKFPKTFVFFNQRLHFVLDEFVKGLVFDQEEYAPILRALYNGNLRYEKVTPYNQKWLPRDADGNLIPDNKCLPTSSLQPGDDYTQTVCALRSPFGQKNKLLPTHGSEAVPQWFCFLRTFARHLL